MANPFDIANFNLVNFANTYPDVFDLSTSKTVEVVYKDANGNIATRQIDNIGRVKENFDAWKNNIRNEYPVINLYEHPNNFGRTTDDTSIPLGCYGWSDGVDRSYSYREFTDDDKNLGFPDKNYINTAGILICKEHWKATKDDAKIISPNALGHPRRKDTGYITISFMYRITNATGNFKDRLEAMSYITDGNWHKRNVVFHATNSSYKGWWPIFVKNINNGSEVDFEWAMLIIAPGKMPNLQEFYLEYIAK